MVYVAYETVEIWCEKIGCQEERNVLLEPFAFDVLLIVQVAIKTFRKPGADRVTQSLRLPWLGGVDVVVNVPICIPHILVKVGGVSVILGKGRSELEEFKDVLVPVAGHARELPGRGGSRLFCEGYTALSGGSCKVLGQAFV